MKERTSEVPNLLVSKFDITYFMRHINYQDTKHTFFP